MFTRRVIVVDDRLFVVAENSFDNNNQLFDNNKHDDAARVKEVAKESKGSAVCTRKIGESSSLEDCRIRSELRRQVKRARAFPHPEGSSEKGIEMIQTRKSNPNKPIRIMVYGVEGVGKSTLGARADRPVFLTPEGGTDRLVSATGSPIDEMPTTSWDQLRANVKALTNEQHDFKTVIIDSADWVEKLCHAKIIGTSGRSIITCNGGYGTGYRESERLHRELIEELSALREKRNVNIIVTAHAHVKAVKDPEMTEDYDAFEIKCHEMVSSLWREWVDGLFFVRFRTFVKAGEEGKKAKALGDDSRVLYTVKRPAFQAKNRFGLAPEYNFTTDFWSELMKLTAKGTVPETVEQVKADIGELLKKIPANDAATLKAASESIEKSGNEIGKLNAIRNRLRDITGGTK